MSDEKKQLRSRMDFITEIISFDEKKSIVSFSLIPNPKRYEWITIKGKRCLYDRLDNVYISEDVLDQMAKQAVGIPIYLQQQELGNAQKYVEDRKDIIEEKLIGKDTEVTLSNKSDDFLNSLAKDKMAFVILCMDIVGSTKMATTLEDKQYAKIISIVLSEVSEIIPKFHGHVLKYTGDGLIAYFAEPSFITKNDLALDCALSIIRLIYNGVNPVFKKYSYPTIDIRIGIDSGEAYVIIIGCPDTKQHKDIIGAVVNLSSKIQSIGKSGDILMGEVTLKNLHTNWRINCEEVSGGENWEYKGSGGEKYRIYKYKYC